MVNFVKSVRRPRHEFGQEVISVSPLIVSSYDRTVVVPYVNTYKTIDKVSVSTPNYRQLVSKGKSLPMNDYSFSTHDVSGDVVYSHRTSDFVSGYGWIYANSVTTVPGQRYGVVNGSYVIDFSAAGNKLLKKIKGETWQSGVAMAEVGKTVRLVESTARRLAFAIHALRHGRLQTAFRWLGLDDSQLRAGGAHRRNREITAFQKGFGVNPSKAAASKWLELQYGWKPLLMDVDAAFKHLDGSLQKEQNRVIRTTVKHVLTGNDVSHNVVYEVSPVGRATVRTYFSVVYRIGVKYKVVDSVATAFHTAGLTNPAEVIWELIPFSFVADWFAPIGDALSVLDATMDKTFVSGWQSASVRETEEWFPTYFDFANQGISGSFVRNHYRKVRQKLVSFPAVSVPQLSVKLGLERMLSSVALLRVQASKLRL